MQEDCIKLGHDVFRVLFTNDYNCIDFFLIVKRKYSALICDKPVAMQGERVRLQCSYMQESTYTVAGRCIRASTLASKSTASPCWYTVELHWEVHTSVEQQMFSFQCLLRLDSTYKQYRQTREWIRLQFNLPWYEGRSAAVQRHWPWMSLVPRLGLVVLDLLFAFCIHTKITHRLCQCLSSYKHTGVELSFIWTSFLLLLTVWTLHCWFSILIIQLLLLLH